MELTETEGGTENPAADSEKKAFALASQEMADGLTETGARQEESEVCSRLLCLVVDSDLL